MKKKFLMSLLSVLLVSPLFATEIPDCWDDEEHQPRIADGSFIITLETEIMTKEDLLYVMGVASGHYVEANRYPMIYDDYVIIETNAVDYGAGEYRLSRRELIEAVEEELEPIAAIDGVSITCNHRVYPRPHPRDEDR